MDILFPLHPFHRHRHHHRLKLKSPFNLFSSSYFHFQPFSLSLSLYQTNKTLRWWHVLSFSPSFLAWLDIFFLENSVLCTAAGLGLVCSLSFKKDIYLMFFSALLLLLQHIVWEIHQQNYPISRLRPTCVFFSKVFLSRIPAVTPFLSLSLWRSHLLFFILRRADQQEGKKTHVYFFLTYFVQRKSSWEGKYVKNGSGSVYFEVCTFTWEYIYMFSSSRFSFK